MIPTVTFALLLRQLCISFDSSLARIQTSAGGIPGKKNAERPRLKAIRHPGCLSETLGFPSHSREWFSIIVYLCAYIDATKTI